MSGAGKSTLSQAVRAQLEARALPVAILDGDVVRTFLSRGLGFSRPDREENLRRIGYVARLLAKHGVAAITAAISLYKTSRDEVRQLARQAGVKDPWRPEVLANVPANQQILLIGTGLTMLDVVLDLRARGVTGMIHAISRRGLVPQGHRTSRS